MSYRKRTFSEAAATTRGAEYRGAGREAAGLQLAELQRFGAFGKAKSGGGLRTEVGAVEKAARGSKNAINSAPTGSLRNFFLRRSHKCGSGEDALSKLPPRTYHTRIDVEAEKLNLYDTRLTK